MPAEAKKAVEATDLGKMKGNAVRAFHEWYEREPTAARFRERIPVGLPVEFRNEVGLEYRQWIAEACPPEYEDLLDPSREAFGILASHWYPMMPIQLLLDRMLGGASTEDKDAMADVAGPFVMNVVLSGLQRRVFKLLMSPDRYRKYVQMAWDQNFDSGDIEVVEADHEHHGFVRNWRGHHPFMCRLIHAGKLAIYQAMGCKGVTVEMTGCISRGDEACSSRVRWR